MFKTMIRGCHEKKRHLDFLLQLVANPTLFQVDHFQAFVLQGLDLYYLNILLLPFLEFIKENPRTHFVGLSNKKNLIFKSGLNEIRITDDGLI